MSRAVSLGLPAPPRAWSARLIPALVVLAMTGCSAGSDMSSVGPSGSAADGSTTDRRADLETQAACRQRVSEMYDHQNRGEIYSANSSMNSPFSANYQSGMSTHDLADQYSYGKIESACERDTGTGAERTDEAVPPPAKGH